MSSSAFRYTPAYRVAAPGEQFLAALDQPMGPWQTFWDQTKGGVLESFGLGTVIRDLSIPQGATPRPTPVEPLSSFPIFGQALDQSYRAFRDLVNPVDPGAGTLSLDDYKASPYFRDNIPWDAGMTEDRAAALASWSDAKAVRDFFGQKRPFTSFFGNLAGQAVDPINYIPIAGPTVRAASAMRFGTIAGRAAMSSLDAAANTALFGVLTRDTRASFGDDVSWQMMTSEIAMSAMIGAAFGGVSGVLARRSESRAAAQAAQRLETLENVQQSRIALNEAIGSLADDGRVALGPNSADAIGAMARQQFDIAPQIRDRIVASGEGLSQDVAVLKAGPIPEPPRGTTRVYAVGQRPQDAFVPDRLTTDIDAARTFAAQTPDAKLFYIDAPEGQTLARVARGDPDMPAAMTELTPELRVEVAALARSVAPDAPVLTPEQRELARVMDRWGIDYRGMEPEQAARRVRDIALNLRERATPDLSTGRPDARPEGIADAAARADKPDSIKETAQTHRVDPETGDYLEAGEIEQVRQEGRLTEDDEALLAEQQDAYDRGVAYGRALEAAVNCLI